MAEKFEFTDYNGPMWELLQEMNPVQVFEFEGMDLSDLNNFKIGNDDCFLRCYKADKIEKITISKMNFFGGMLAGGTVICPAEDSDLPTLSSDWDESEDHIHAIIDFIPGDDPARNADYLKNYLYEPLEEIYKKYCHIPGLAANVFHWVRAFQSPYMLTGHIKQVDKGKHVQDFFKCSQEYLKKYIEIWKKSEKKDPNSPEMKLVHERRKNIRESYRYNDPGEGPLTKVLGADRARRILNTLMP